MAPCGWRVQFRLAKGRAKTRNAQLFRKRQADAV